jgi:hypothetical protein
MWKKWLLALPILFCLLACEGLTTTGTNDPVSNPCRGISKKNAYSYIFFFELNCPLKERCSAYFSFLGSGVGDTLDGRCFSGYELKFENAGKLRTVFENRSYPISLSENNHVQFSLVDEDNKEKKYDIDLSGIVNSYTIRGDTVDVNVMENCSLHLYSCKKETVYGNGLLNGQYTFFITEGCDKDYSYDCVWHNLGPSRKDDLEIHTKIYWSK